MFPKGQRTTAQAFNHLRQRSGYSATNTPASIPITPIGTVTIAAMSPADRPESDDGWGLGAAEGTCVVVGVGVDDIPEPGVAPIQDGSESVSPCHIDIH